MLLPHRGQSRRYSRRRVVVARWLARWLARQRRPVPGHDD